MSKPRVLLVEDDSMLRQFVRMALEELDIELLEADSVAVAMGFLAHTQPQLILTDLMMPGESGLDLLEHLQRRPELRGTARVVVLSAGVNAVMREHLQAYDVWRLLLKPVSVVELEGCVREALMVDGTLTEPGEPMEPPEKPPLSREQLAHGQANALASYFGGDRRLFDAYLASCLVQFPDDVTAGDQAMLRGDLHALRLQAHSLKTVLRTLGYTAADLAQSLEASCLAGLAKEAGLQWAALRMQLLALVTTR